MFNNKTTISILTCLFCFLSVSPAYALSSDLQYQFETKNEEEFVNVGESNINFQGAVPDYLLDIYDLTPQQKYDSQYGATIVTPNDPATNNSTFAPVNVPNTGYTQSPNGLATGTVQGTQSPQTSQYSQTQGDNKLPSTSNTYVEMQPPNYEPDWEGKPQYPVTSIEEVRNSDGSIGVLKIPSINLKVTAYDGDTFAAMKKGIGHISSTSAWNSTIGLVGHNRGTSDYFGKLKKLEVGDEMTYTTKLGTRTYVVQSVTKISDTDWSKLQYTSDNRLTLLTCVEDVPTKRLCVQAVEKR